MKRRWASLLTTVCMITLLLPQAAAYDFRNDTLADDPAVVLTEELEQAILEEYETTRGESSAAALCPGRAVKVYRFTPEDMLAALEGDLAAALEEHSWTVWKVPIEGGSGYDYAVLTAKEFSTCYSDTPTESLAFLWAPETVEERLAGVAGDLYLTNIPTWGITLYINLDGSETRLMADAGRPDWFGIENWAWYSREEMLDILNAYADQTGFAPGSGGGGGTGGGNVVTNLVLPLSVGAGVVLLAVLLVLIPRWKEKQ